MSFISRLHIELRNARHTRRGATQKPDDVPRGAHKAYPRMSQIHLPEPENLSMSIASVLQKRKSGSSGDADKEISLQDIGTILGLALRKHPGDSKRNYPSGGALYPIETYLISCALESQKPGVFHYNPSKHALERLSSIPENFEMKELAKYPDWLELSSLVVFTSVWMRSAAKYGELAYQHALLEAGHMSENVLLVCTAKNIHSRPYAGFNDKLIIELLDLDEGNEQPVHAITLCKE